jgi:hypothetical protein
MKHHFLSAASIAVLAVGMILSSCSQPSSPSQGGGQVPVINENHDPNPTHKGKNNTLSVDVSVDNQTTEAVTVRAIIGLSHQDLVVTGYGTWPYSIPNSMTGLEINSQTVLINTPTNVTLPNSDVVGVTWNTTENGVIVVIEEELG